MPELTGYGTIRYVAVSLPFVAGLVDGVKNMLPADVKQSEDDTERRRQRAPRAPSLKRVRLAQQCDGAEQLGKKLRRRDDRQRQRVERGRVLQD